jgi:hypothetical protein
MNLFPVFTSHLMRMALQLADSNIESTRIFWRREKLGLPEEIVLDTRPLGEIAMEREHPTSLSVDIPAGNHIADHIMQGDQL